MMTRKESGLISRKAISTAILSLALVTLLGSVARPQQDVPGNEDPFAGYSGVEDSSRKEVKQHGGMGPVSPTFPKVWCDDVTDEATEKMCWEAYRAGLAYYETGLQHRARVFAWQHFSTRVIFVVVLLLVGIGIFFAWVQFRRGEPTEQNELEISMQGVKITSPVIGLIILTLSLAFFYLYLVHVYPIHELI